MNFLRGHAQLNSGPLSKKKKKKKKSSAAHFVLSVTVSAY